jgi:diphthamide synthase (EF-2-diphthine--ammonia ligase)
VAADVLLSWSSGKDSAWLLHALRRGGDARVVGLLTTLHESGGRVAVHAVRERLLDAQARACGLPLVKVRLPDPCPNEEYERRLGDAVARARAEGVSGLAFGDLFLADIRAYRERICEGWGIEPLFPLFGADTRSLAERRCPATSRGAASTRNCYASSRRAWTRAARTASSTPSRTRVRC